MSAIEYRLPQERRIVTEFPGPRSAALAERRKKVVGAGVASTLPVYVADADGGVIVDVDGNSLIDLGAGIAVTSVGASNPAVVSAVQDQVAHFTHTCFMVAPYEGYVEVAERLAELTPVTTRSVPCCSTPAQKLSRTQSRSPVTQPVATQSSSSTTRTTAAPTSRWH